MDVMSFFLYDWICIYHDQNWIKTLYVTNFNAYISSVIQTAATENEQRTFTLSKNFCLARVYALLKKNTPVIISEASCTAWSINLLYLHRTYICTLLFMIREFVREQNSVSKCALNNKTPLFQRWLIWTSLIGHCIHKLNIFVWLVITRNTVKTCKKKYNWKISPNIN